MSKGKGDGGWKGAVTPGWAASGNSRIRSTDSSRVQDRRTPEQRQASRLYQQGMGPVPAGSQMDPKIWRTGGHPQTTATSSLPKDLYPLMPGAQSTFIERKSAPLDGTNRSLRNSGLAPSDMGPRAPSSGAMGLNGSYGMNTAGHPGRQVARY